MITITLIASYKIVNLEDKCFKLIIKKEKLVCRLLSHTL